MKHVFLLVMLLSVWTSGSIAAQNFPSNTKPVKVQYPVVISSFKSDRLIENLNIQHGSIVSTGDSSVIFAKTDTVFHPKRSLTEIIPVSNIYEIKVKKQKDRNGAILIGAGIGMLLGGIIAYGNGKPGDSYLDGGSDGAKVRAAFGALTGSALGASCGVFISIIYKKTIQVSIPILSNQDTYRAKRKKLQSISITGQ